ncbi:three-Cys-motif partner protein TcmP [Fluviicola sp.]|jgi:three-Cys-motif partner protein|uniref:three-Cys-motif partner protein TcmP n=1 Tax=Fluviicola sp. TaxID=1917219 RepID=UPI002822CA60|nr:three-Cys-motif partner protein TcmP [Fluviicola sp.]MDR0802658.1 three-Cys-motif partner protein TcmP [Fluviicola sp.]
MNLHDKPFDETTITKLKLFEDYAQAWIPTFIMQSYVKEIHIFDFFAGTGYDLKEVPGSPIRLIEKIIEQRGNIFQKKIKMVLHLNEFDKGKHELLVTSCSNRLKQENGMYLYVKLEFYNKDFGVLFPELLPIIKKYPSLVYLDQNGVKFLSNQYLKQLESTKQTDFLYFAASSYIRRFGELEEFKNHLSNIDVEELKNTHYHKVHRILTKQLQKNISSNSNLKLFPFSLKKNIYGVIFGASHFSAFNKFLNIAWKYNGKNGDANFDIDDETNIGQLSMFEGPRLTKIEAFQQQVRDKILNRDIKTNKELLNFVFENGHIGKHADECLREMKNQKLITYNSKSPCVTYDSIIKNKIVHYEKI